MPHSSRLLPALALLALTACGEGEAAGHGNALARQQSARAAAEAGLRVRMRMPEQRGVQVFAQALPDSVVVCGRARGATGEAFLPYVALIAFAGETPRLASFHLGTTGHEASRVFLEMVERCFEGGGPASARAMARNLPPLPEIPVLQTPAPEAPVQETASIKTTVTTSARSGANIRASSRGGEILRSVPPSTRLELISEAPGGWVQVGERGVALGWVHGSMLEPR